VTAKHVLFDPDNGQLRGSRVQLLSYSKEIVDSDSNLAILDLEQLRKSGDLKSHPAQDVAVIRIALAVKGKPASPENKPKLPSNQGINRRKINFIPGVTPIRMSVSGITGADEKSVKTFDHVLVGNDVIVFGYPTSLGLPKIPQLDPRTPLLRKGMVAGVNLQQKSIILTARFIRVIAEGQ
jgi:hypothetical protein